MKIKLPEHDHKLTNLLKVLLFSLLMLLPFLDIGTRCGYVLLNKNAYQSYYGETINQEEIQTYNSYSDLPKNKTIYYDSVNYSALFTDAQYTSVIMIQNLDNIDTNFAEGKRLLEENKDSILFIYTLNTTTNPYLSFRTSNVDIITNIPLQSFYLRFTFNYLGQDLASPDVLQFLTTKTYNSYSYLDNVFDYSINKMANSPLYNWTTQTGMYTGVNAMTTGLGITTPLFAILITYWMFLTIIYIILDIVLSLFTFMTHIFTKKE